MQEEHQSSKCKEIGVEKGGGRKAGGRRGRGGSDVELRVWARKKVGWGGGRAVLRLLHIAQHGQASGTKCMKHDC